MRCVSPTWPILGAVFEVSFPPNDTFEKTLFSLDSRGGGFLFSVYSLYLVFEESNEWVHITERFQVLGRKQWRRNVSKQQNATEVPGTKRVLDCVNDNARATKRLKTSGASPSICSAGALPLLPSSFALSSNTVDLSLRNIACSLNQKFARNACDTTSINGSQSVIMDFRIEEPKTETETGVQPTLSDLSTRTEQVTDSPEAAIADSVAAGNFDGPSMWHFSSPEDPFSSPLSSPYSSCTSPSSPFTFLDETSDAW